MAGKSTASAAENKEKALEQALEQIQKQYGKGAIMKLGEEGLRIHQFGFGDRRGRISAGKNH